MIVIVQKDNPVLRQEAKQVPISEISSRRIQLIIKHMKEALASQEDGVAIAAPQIGERLAIFVISNKVFSMVSGKKNVLKDGEDMVFINPVITSLSKAKADMEEGCLSVRWLYGKVKRSVKATIKAYNEKGFEFTKKGDGLLAQIFQHEVDHLHGILFHDKAFDIKDVPPEKHE